MSFKRIISLTVAIFTVCVALFGAGCSGAEDKNHKQEKNTENAGALSGFSEVAELNASLELPLPIGADEAAVKAAGFEALEGGEEHHLMTYRSKENLDVIFTLGTRELHYGEPNPKTALYVTACRIMPVDRQLVKNDDGSTSTVYTTERSVLGIKVGNNINDAKKILLDKGYEVAYEEPREEHGLPKAIENTFKKGIIYITFAVEVKGDISQIFIWVPYEGGKTDSFNQKSSLPAALGSMYSVLANPDFSYVGKTDVARRYESEDGSVAITRGFPDYRDMNMTAEVSFTSDKYNALGVRVGMAENEAAELLKSAGCTLDASGCYVFEGEIAVKLDLDNGTVARITAALRPSTNLSGIALEETSADSGENK